MDKIALNKDRPVQFILLGIAIVGIVELAFSTRYGAGIGGDATIYLTSARNLLEGRGLGLITASGDFRLLPYAPPFFSLTLAFWGSVGLDLSLAARWMNIILFGGLLYLAGWTTFRLAGSRFYAVLAALVLLTSPVLVPVYSWAMAEPLSLLLGFGGLVILLPQLRDGGSPTWSGLIGSGVLFGLGALTRYSDVAFALAGAAGLILFSQCKLRERLVRASLLLGVSALPVIIWLVISLQQTATFSSRAVDVGQGLAQRTAVLLPALGKVFLFWLIPDSWIADPPYPAIANWLLLGAGVLGLAVGVGAVAWWIWRKRAIHWRVERVIFGVCLFLFILFYFLLILVIYISTYPPITIGSRMFAPMYIAILWFAVLLSLLAGEIWLKYPGVKWMLATLLVIGVVWYGWRSSRIIWQNYELGLGYNSLAWRNSPVVQMVRALPPDTVLVTNEEMAILYLTGRRAYPLMEVYLNQPLRTFSRYGDGDVSDDPAQKLFQEGKAVLVLFNSIQDQMESIYGEQAVQRVEALRSGLKIIARLEDGGLYAYPQP